MSFIMVGTVYAQAPAIQAGEKTETLLIEGQEVEIRYNLDSNNNGYVKIADDVFVREGDTVYMNGERVATITTTEVRTAVQIPQPRFSWTYTPVCPGNPADYSVYTGSKLREVSLTQTIASIGVVGLTAILAIFIKVPEQAKKIAQSIVVGVETAAGIFGAYASSKSIYCYEEYYEHIYTPQFNHKTIHTQYYDRNMNDKVPGGSETSYAYWS